MDAMDAMGLQWTGPSGQCGLSGRAQIQTRTGQEGCAFVSSLSWKFLVDKKRRL